MIQPLISRFFSANRPGAAVASINAGLSPETTQILSEKRKTFAHLLPAIMLGNILLASIVYLAAASVNGVEITSIAYLPICTISFYIVILLRNSSIALNNVENLHATQVSHLWMSIISFSLGCFWALLPPAIAFLTTGHQVAVALAVLVGILCVGAFTLLLTATLAVPFLVPVLTSCYITLFLSGTDEGLYLATALTIFMSLIILLSINDTRSKAKALLERKALIKQQKTIALLLRDFDKHASHWLWETGADLKFVRVFERFKDVSGRSEMELMALTIPELASPNARSLPSFEALVSAIQTKKSFTDVHMPVIVNNETCWWAITGTPDFDETGAFRGFHGVASDITQQKASDERIQFLALHDALTGLYNRAHFTELLHKNVSRLERYGASFAVMFFDLDFFKSVNDTYGHPMGDKLLVDVAARIRSIMPSDAQIARLGGDEFAVIFPDALTAAKLQHYANATLEAIARPFEIDGENLQIGVSIGIALAPHHGTRPDQLLRNVDLALYRAKETGRNSFCVFEAGMDSVARERRALEFDLRYAIEGNELELFYQPYVDASNDKPIGFEALLRWNHPIRGQVSPAEFIPIAEATGLIGSIGDWVMQEACLEAAKWPEHLSVAVNLSALQFSKDRVVEIVTRSLAMAELRADRLELEITESLLIDQPEDAIAKLKHLKSLGISIAMDDFGTGYSSLSYMLKFPFDKIKVDKSFISAVKNGNAASDVLRTISSLGKSLNVQMTAEGVETFEQAAFLKSLNFDILQGFYYSKPLRAAEIPGLLMSLTSKQLTQSDDKIVKLRSSAA